MCDISVQYGRRSHPETDERRALNERLRVRFIKPPAPWRLLAGLWFGLVALVGGSLREASAHGRFPLAGQIAVDPSDPMRVFVRTTYGILVTEDGSNNWSWICPEGPGFDADTEDPAIIVGSDGSLLVGTFDGLSRASDLCSFATAEGTPPDSFFVDLQRGSAPSVLRAVSSNGVSSDVFDVAVWGSTDDGATWSQLGVAPPSDVLALTLATAPSDDDRLYLSGRGGSAGSYEGVIMRSDDAGATWQRLTVPGADDMTLPYLGAVDPVDPDIFYVGLVRVEDQEVVYYGLLVTQDGGQTFTEVFTRTSNMPGFALSPDGTTVAIGGAEEGLWLADASSLQFAKANETVVRCLNWTDAGIYACTDQFVDGFNLGLSTDEGATFTPLSELSSPCGPPTCDASTPVGEFCPAEWQVERLELGATTCGDGGDGGGGGAGSGGGGSEPAPPADDGGCGCHVPGANPSPPWGFAVGAIALALALARRRR